MIYHELLGAYAAAAAANSLRAFRADVAAFLVARPKDGAAPASLTRYRASIAKLHRLSRLPGPCQDELVKLTLIGHRRKLGVAQMQARPLRFRGAVKDPLTDAPLGINVRTALDVCGNTLPALRDRALLSVAYDTGLRASEPVAIKIEDLIEALDPNARLLKIERSKGDWEGEGATAYLSPRSVSAVTHWLAEAGIAKGRCFGG